MAHKQPQSRRRVPCCKALPPEIWIRVFSHHTDPAHLWLVCRRISPALRACAEHAFAAYFLCLVQIEFQLEKYNLGGKSKRPVVPVVFDRVGKLEEKEKVWFKDKRPVSAVCEDKGQKGRIQFQKTMQRWEENVKQRKAEMPNYTITISGMVNDTDLPDLEIDVEKHEVCFQWKKMLHLFFREHEQIGLLKDLWQVQTTQQIRENNARLAKGEHLMPADFPPPWSTAEAEMRKRVRRARLKEYYRDDELLLWAIESLKYFEQYGAASGANKALKLDPKLPGVGLGEKWFGHVHVVQELYLDEWSCMHRIDTQIGHLRTAR
ncbi:hypothetical protein BDU57DRAFT_521417 [Ampelomyces quisqualis]|uniref:F-box domain-containing protein n=1 Tax=Ampelomyces quisqualis TaxID=50730 RepID=A0A6A5QDB0_AMPQU|nr:hypothetical protein BDU57DRAFT_521417 [Ampelomyces quisqualis]